MRDTSGWQNVSTVMQRAGELVGDREVYMRAFQRMIPQSEKSAYRDYLDIGTGRVSVLKA